MTLLDQPDRLASLDPKSMCGLIESLPIFMAGAERAVQSLSLLVPRRVAQVIVSGMGGSAIGGDVIRAAFADVLKVPMLVCRDYRLPAFIDDSTLVFASSYSGNTEETLSAYGQAHAAGSSIICITSGGKLAAQARSDGYPVIGLPPGLPPRSALGYSSVTLLSAMTSLGLVPDASAALHETIGLLTRLVPAYGPSAPQEGNPAKAIAASLHGKLVAIYGSSSITDPAAVRWRGQLEENAKNLAFHHLLPEMNHNELVGWDLPPQVLQHVGVVFLRDRHDHPQVMRRFDLTRELVAEKAGSVHEVWGEGASTLARIFSIICLGDFVSFYLACLNAVDPTPVAVIELLKQKLGS